MNIEEIKKKVDRFKDDWERSRQCCDIEDFSDDVLYLLSIIEQATTFFEKVEEWESFSKENVLEASRKHMKAIRGN